MSAALDMYLASRSYSPASERQRRSILSRFEEECGPGPDVTADGVLRWWVAQAELKPSSRRVVLIAARNYLDWLRKSGQRTDNPAELVRAPTVHTSPPKVLTRDQVCALRQSIQGKAYRILIVGLMLDMGLRIGEVTRLRGEDLHEGVLRVHGKGGKEAQLPVAPTVAEVWPEVPGPIVNVCTDHLRAVVKDWFTEAGIQGHSPHSLRRTFATEAVRRGVQPHVLAAILRHASVATSSHYVRVSLEDMAQALLEAS